jgi:serine/threonine protein kinase
MTAAAAYLAGRYELKGLIGHGGMATVHRAWDHRLGREVAIKRLSAMLATDPSVRHRFEDEANAAARISHHNVVTTFDIDDHNGEPFIVMECLAGTTLAQELSNGALPNGRVRRIALDTLGGLAAAHDLGVIHRDIKPANLLIAADGSIKIADFGIAKSLATADHTATGDVVGSVAYIAPERLEGHAATYRSDLYSLGVVLYEAASGRKPFVGDTPVAVAHAIVGGRVTPVREVRPEIDASLADVIDRAMAKRPEDRFATAIEMAAPLRRPESEQTIVTPVVEPFGEETELHTFPAASPTAIHSFPPAARDRAAPKARARGPWILVFAVAIAALAVIAVAMKPGSSPATGRAPAVAPTVAPKVVSSVPRNPSPAGPANPMPKPLQTALTQLENAVAR